MDTWRRLNPGFLRRQVAARSPNLIRRERRYRRGGSEVWIGQHIVPAESAHVAAAPLARLLALSTEAAALIGHFDHVTRLPNRLQFLEDFSLLASPGSEAPLLVMVTLAEARHYNEVLRALGHAFAEDFVRAGAEKLSPCCPLVRPSIMSRC